MFPRKTTGMSMFSTRGVGGREDSDGTRAISFPPKKIRTKLFG